MNYPDALCRDAPIVWFLPDENPITGKQPTAAPREAEALCAMCPHLEECLIDSIESKESYGVRGGCASGGSARRELRRAWQTGDPETWREALAAHLRRITRDPDAPKVNANGPGATHGQASTYNRGCECVACSEAKRLQSLQDADRVNLTDYISTLFGES